MAKKTIAELLTEAKALKEKQKQINAEMKAKKTAIATEYIDNMPEAEKQKQISDAEKILTTAKQELITAKEKYKVEVKRIKESFIFAKSILDFVNYKSNYSLPKVKNQFRIEKNILTFKREGIKDILIDVSKTNWEKTFKEELKKQGINGDNRIADNIIYKAQKLLQANDIKELN